MEIKFKKQCLDKSNVLNISLHMNNIKDEGYKEIESFYRKISGFDVVICQFKNQNSTEIRDGSDNVMLEFNCKNVPINLKNAYFVWWNDDQPYKVVEMEAIILKIIVDNILISTFPEIENRKILPFNVDISNIPRQGGNGGVLGITDCP